MMPNTPDPPFEGTASDLAGEYVLGTLSAPERKAFERDMADDPALTAQVQFWQAKLSALDETAMPVTPSAGHFAALEVALFASPSGRPDLRLIEGGMKASQTADFAALDAPRQSLRRWRTGAIGAGMVAASLAAALVVTSSGIIAQPPAGQQNYVAVVNRGGDQPALIVRVDLASGTVLIRPVAAQTPAGKSLELWYVADKAAPRSLGLLGEQSRRAGLSLPAGTAGLDKAVFAVSVEPEGGSPTGGPTGPVIYSGQLIKE